MIDAIAVALAVLIVGGLYALLAFAARGEREASGEIKERKLEAIAERDRIGHRARNGSRREA